jgi:hypothetical protein
LDSTEIPIRFRETFQGIPKSIVQSSHQLFPPTVLPRIQLNEYYSKSYAKSHLVLGT